MSPSASRICSALLSPSIDVGLSSGEYEYTYWGRFNVHFLFSLLEPRIWSPLVVSVIFKEIKGLCQKGNELAVKMCDHCYPIGYYCYFNHLLMRYMYSLKSHEPLLSALLAETPAEKIQGFHSFLPFLPSVPPVPLHCLLPNHPRNTHSSILIDRSSHPSESIAE